MRGIYIGLGSNLGDRQAHLQHAKSAFHVVAESPFYASAAMLPENAPPDWNRPFLNQVIEIETALSPQTLLAELKRLEGRAGRRDRGRWSPRELDLDIIAYGDEIVDTDVLTVPHAGYQQRDFVLLPLRDIAPSWPDIDRMITALPEITAEKWTPHTELMGVLNITPDSFSDGGAMDTASILQRFETLVQDGADIVDIGAESTRPNATPLTAEQEWQRLEAPLTAVTAHPLRGRVRISIDTRHGATATRACAMGVDWINDVSGLREDAMVEVLRDALCDVVVMHALTIPADSGVTLPDACDPVAEILAWKREVLTRGIPEARLIFDAGLGFGKTPQQSLELVERAEELVASGGRWLFGHSRKSFLKLIEDIPANQRDALTLRYSKLLIAKGVHFLRVHDVAGHRL